MPIADELVTLIEIIEKRTAEAWKVIDKETDGGYEQHKNLGKTYAYSEVAGLIYDILMNKPLVMPE